MRRTPPLLAAIALCFLLLVALATLGPFGIKGAIHDALDAAAVALDETPSLSWVSFGMLEFAANVLLFVPVGVCAVFLFGLRRWWLAVIVGVFLSVAIEAAQLVLPGTPSVRDIISNSMGTVIGVLLALPVAAIASRRHGRPGAGAARPESDQAALLE